MSWLQESAEFRALLELVAGMPSTSELESLYRLELSLELMTRQAVLDYRAAGWTWHEVGQALGTTRQAVQQRYGRKLRVHPSLGNLPPALDGLE